MPKGAKVLIYRIDLSAPKGIKLRNILRISGAAYQVLEESSCGQTLGYLLGLEGFSERPLSNELAEGEAVIFYNFSRQDLDRLLGALKREGIAIPLKAVVTEHNVNWTIAKLVGELKQEHLLMKSWQKLSACVKKYKGKDKELIKEAKELLSSHAPEVEALDEMLSRFSE